MTTLATFRGQTAVFWGMLVTAFLRVLIIPGNFAFVERLGFRRRKAPERSPSVAPAQGEHS